jgi:hypothetical protein
MSFVTLYSILAKIYCCLLSIMYWLCNNDSLVKRLCTLSFRRRTSTLIIILEIFRISHLEANCAERELRIREDRSLIPSRECRLPKLTTEVEKPVYASSSMLPFLIICKNPFTAKDVHHLRSRCLPLLRFFFLSLPWSRQ